MKFARWPTVRRVGLVLAWSVVPLLSSAWANFDLQRIPDAQTLAAIQQSGWSAAADALEEKIVAAWKPSGVGQVGSAANENFRHWLLLYRWCRLLGTPEPDVLQDYLGRRVFENPEKERALLIVPPGMKLPTDRTGRLLPTAADQLDHAQIPAEILQVFLPDDYTLQNGEVALRAKQDFLLQLAGDKAFLQEFFRMLSPDDFPPVVLMRLEELSSAFPNYWPEYRSLALAFAFVYDQRRPTFWPHPQVTPEAVPSMEEPLTERFAYYVRLNNARRLDYDLRSMTAAELKFLVDAAVPQSELEWAAKNVRARRDRFEDAFSAIAYDQKRVKKNAFQWPHGDYRLSNIKVWGGICVDQAYFAALAGKARGIPTLFFAGQGKDGGHAWFGYWRGNGRWEMDGGRYVNQNYTVGEALDPQTWLPITDHELLYLSGRASRGPGYDAALADLAMAKIFTRQNNASARLTATESALFNAPGLVIAWEAKEQALEAAEADLRVFYTQAIERFRREEDLKVRYQARLADYERAAGDGDAATKIENRMIRENRRDRTDLSVATGAGALQRCLEAQDFEGAMREYRTITAKLGRTGGGNFFYDVVRPFVRQLREAGRDRDAERALQMARRAMTPERGSVLAKDFAELENGAAKNQ